MEWKTTKMGNEIFSNNEGVVYLSYNTNDVGIPRYSHSDLDSANPETAIVLIKNKKSGDNRYLIYRGDWREELTAIYPDVEKLKEHWKKHGGHFFTDNLED